MNRAKAQVIRFPQTEKVKDKPRKIGLNTNKERTLWGYKSYLDRYLKPYFGNLSFGGFNKITFTKFIS